MVLLIIALFGLFIPNGLFIYWTLNEFHSAADVVNNRLALGFMIEAFVMLGLLANWFAKNPPGKIKWYWFVVFSLIGGLGFGLPFYWWLSKRNHRTSAV